MVAPTGRAAKRSHDRTGRDEWTDSRDSKRADAGEQTEHAACDAAGGRTGGRAFRRFGGFDMTDVMLALVVWQAGLKFPMRESRRLADPRRFVPLESEILRFRILMFLT